MKTAFLFNFWRGLVGETSRFIFWQPPNNVMTFHQRMGQRRRSSTGNQTNYMLPSTSRWCKDEAKAGTASNVTLLLLRKFHMTLWHDQQKPTTKPRKTHKFLFFHLSKRVIFMFQQHLRNIWPPFTHCNMSTAAWLCLIASSEDIQLPSTKWNVKIVAFKHQFLCRFSLAAWASASAQHVMS